MLKKQSTRKINVHLPALPEGRQFQSIGEEALLDIVEKRKTPGPRAHVMAQYQASVNRNTELYERLAG
jgi:hypothetical protein